MIAKIKKSQRARKYQIKKSKPEYETKGSAVCIHSESLNLLHLFNGLRSLVFLY